MIEDLGDLMASGRMFHVPVGAGCAHTPLSCTEEQHWEITAMAKLGCCKSCSLTAECAAHPAVPGAASSSWLTQIFIGISFLWQGSVREYGGGSSVGIYICVAPGPTHSS